MLGGIHSGKHVLLLHFLLFKEKDGCFQEVGRKDRLANFLDVFAFESKLVGWGKLWTLTFWEFLNIAISCLLLLAGVTWHPRVLRWQAIHLEGIVYLKVKAVYPTYIRTMIFLENSYPTKKNNSSDTFFCWGLQVRKKQPGKQNKIQPFWGQGMDDHQRIQLGSHRFRFTSQILTPMCLDCLDGRWLRRIGDV